jgi:Alkylmercury lyase
MPLEIKTVDELVDPELEARWVARRADRRSALLRHVIRRFVDQPGPASVEDIAAAFPDRDAGAVRVELTELHDKDLLLLRDGRVELAYPFSGAPTTFTVAWGQGEERFACCAIDALGIAPMLGRRIAIRSRCHHCQAPLEFAATPDGPAPDAAGVMVWVGRRGESERRISDSL